MSRMLLVHDNVFRRSQLCYNSPLEALPEPFRCAVHGAPAFDGQETRDLAQHGFYYLEVLGDLRLCCVLFGFE